MLKAEHRDPFEIVVARRAPEIWQSHRPAATFRVGDVDYVEDENPRVQVPKISLDPEPKFSFDGLYKMGPVENKAPDPPPVRLRESIRACVKSGMSQEEIVGIFRLEIVESVMDS